MKSAWKKLADKIDSLTLRERGIIFIMAALLAVTVLNAVLLDPLSAKQKAATQQIAQMDGEIRSLQAQTLALVQAQSSNPDANLQNRLASVKKKLAEADSILQGKQEHLIPPERIAGVLEELLGRNRRLQLVALNTLPPTPLIEGGIATTSAATPALAATAPVSATENQLFKHGVQITVRGSYPELMAYLADLEKLPWQMFWGGVSLQVEQHPAATLTLTLYTMSLDKIWLKV